VASINQDLLNRLQTKLGISKGRVYEHIKAVSRDRHITRRDVAALYLAWQQGISIQKYATAEQLSRLDAIMSGGAQGAPVSPQMPVAPTARRSRRSASAKRAPKTVSNSVFVVHGRDVALRKSMFEFLRALQLNPMEWEQAVYATRGGNPNVGDIINNAMAQVQAVVVLFSSDEEARLYEQHWADGDEDGEGKPQGQPRPNVLFEAGLALGAHPEKTIIVQVGKVRAFSDIAGKHLVHLSNAGPRRNDLANRLSRLGCDVVQTGSDWMNAGNFVPSPSAIIPTKASRASRKAK
jgi:predicted nucleotide-binding protein